MKSNNFDKQFEKLIKRLKNKTVVIYGAGKMFQEIQNNYDLSKLNISISLLNLKLYSSYYIYKSLN